MQSKPTVIFFYSPNSREMGIFPSAAPASACYEAKVEFSEVVTLIGVEL